MEASQVSIFAEVVAEGVLVEDAAVSGCRFCGGGLRHTFVDLGMSPLCESYVPADRVGAMEAFYPLHAKVCGACLLVQLEEFVAAMAVARFGLDAGSLVVELASNDGYLLQHVVGRGIPALGIEPAANVAAVA